MRWLLNASFKLKLREISGTSVIENRTELLFKRRSTPAGVSFRGLVSMERPGDSVRTSRTVVNAETDFGGN